jgi:calpain-7
MNTRSIHACEELFLFEASTGEEAFYHGTRAAELFLETMETSASNKEKSTAREEFNRVVKKLEQIKKVERNSDQLASRDRTEGHVFESHMARCSPHYTPFPLWEAPKSQLFQIVAGEALFVDDTDFALSVEQLGVLDGWRRPDEIFESHAGHEDPDQLFMRPALNNDLVQDMTTDCSVVASLCAAMRILRHGSKSVSACYLSLLSAAT